MTKFKKILKDYWIFIVGFICIVLFAIFLTTGEVNGTSMLPNYQNGDYILIRDTKNVSRGDVVVIWSEKLQEYLCKRIIGVEGDTVKVQNGVVNVNSEDLVENYVNEEQWNGINVDTVVPDNYVFVMGDNRNHSTDSREIGAIPTDDIVGVVFLDITKYTHLTKNDFNHIIVFCWAVVLLFIILFRNSDRNEQKS